MDDQDMQRLYRSVFTLEGKIRHQEYESFEEFGEIMDKLGKCYKYIKSDIPQSILDAIKSAIKKEQPNINKDSKHKELLEGNIISRKLIRKMRYSPGMSDLTLNKYIQQCLKEGYKYENPGNKIKCLDPRSGKLP